MLLAMLLLIVLMQVHSWPGVRGVATLRAPTCAAGRCTSDSECGDGCFCYLLTACVRDVDFCPASSLPAPPTHRRDVAQP